MTQYDRDVTIVIPAGVLALLLGIVGVLLVFVLFTAFQVVPASRSFAGLKPQCDLFLVPDPTLGWRLIPNLTAYSAVPGHEQTVLFSTDKYGFRNQGPDLPASGTAMLLGDSYVQGYRLDATQTISTQLSRRLGRFVYNFGIGGYSTDQELLVARAALKKFKVDWVVLVFFINDLPFLNQSIAYTKPKPGFATNADGKVRFDRISQVAIPSWAPYRFKTIFDDSAVTAPATLTIDSPGYDDDRGTLFRLKLRENFNNVRAAIASPTTVLDNLTRGQLLAPRALWHLRNDYPTNTVYEIYNDPKVLAKSWDLAFQMFSHLKSLAEKREARLMVFFLPEEAQVYYPELKYTLPQQDFVRLCQENAIECIEPLSEFIEAQRTFDVYMRDDGHLSPSGADLVAKIIKQHIDRL